MKKGSNFDGDDIHFCSNRKFRPRTCAEKTYPRPSPGWRAPVRRVTLRLMHHLNGQFAAAIAPAESAPGAAPTTSVHAAAADGRVAGGNCIAPGAAVSAPATRRRRLTRPQADGTRPPAYRAPGRRDPQRWARPPCNAGMPPSPKPP